MCATEHRTASLDAVADDFPATTIAFRRHDVDRTFEAIEDVRLAVVSNFKRFVVLVSAMFAFTHGIRQVESDRKYSGKSPSDPKIS